MCVGIPMQVIETVPGVALCESKGQHRHIDTMLVGEQPAGTWLLVFIDAAREVITAEDARKIGDALQALENIMAGSDDIDHLFSDIMAARRAQDRQEEKA